MLTCSDRFADAVANRACQTLPGTQWTLLKRDEPKLPWFSGPTMFSAKAGSTGGQLSMWWKVRRQRYDVVVLACTNEPTYGLLKCMGSLSAFRCLYVIDENLKGSYLTRGNFATTFGYLRRGLAAAWRGWGKKVLRLLSWALSPFGFLYVVFSIGIRSARRVWNRNREVHT